MAALWPVCAATAGPLDRSLVHPEARWVVHVDIESALQSPVGRHLVERMSRDPRQPFARLSRDFGLCPRSDLRGLTVFGLPGKPGDGVSVLTIAGCGDIGAGLARADRCDLTTVERDGFRVHSWKSRHKTFYAAEREGLRASDKLVILADSVRALDIGMGAVSRALHGEKVMPESPLPPGEPGANSFLFVAAGDMNAPGEERPNAELLREARSLVLDVGRDPGSPGDTVYGRATIGAADHKSALKIRQLAQGVLAFMALTAADQPEESAAVGDLVSGVTIVAEEDRCVVSSRHDAKTVIAVYDLMEEKRREARAGEHVEKGGAEGPKAKGDSKR